MKQYKLQWFDYIFCFLYADIIAAGIMATNPIVITIGFLGYLIYEFVRK